MLLENISDQIIKCFYKVYNNLGFGFLEKVYKNALFLELKKAGLLTEKNFKINVFYNDVIVGEYIADLIVEESIIIELKAIEVLVKENELQLINYLKATEIEVGLLLNFGKSPQIKRKIFTNDRRQKGNSDL